MTRCPATACRLAVCCHAWSAITCLHTMVGGSTEVQISLPGCTSMTANANSSGQFQWQCQWDTHEVLGFLQPKSGDGADLLDDFDLGSSIKASELDIKLCLLWLCSHLWCSGLHTAGRMVSLVWGCSTDSLTHMHRERQRSRSMRREQFLFSCMEQRARLQAKGVGLAKCQPVSCPVGCTCAGTAPCGAPKDCARTAGLRFSRFCRSSVRSATSNKFRPQISSTIFSSFGDLISRVSGSNAGSEANHLTGFCQPAALRKLDKLQA